MRVPLTVTMTILHFYFLFAVVDTLLHDHFRCCGHHFTWPKKKKGYIGSCWWALLDKACCSLIKNSALERQHLNTQKLRAQKTMRISQQSGWFQRINNWNPLRVQVFLEIPIFLCHKRERRFEESTTTVMRPTPDLKRKITGIRLQLHSTIQNYVYILLS